MQPDPRHVTVLPQRDELPFRRLERAHLQRAACLEALRRADAELAAAIGDMRTAGYDVRPVATSLDPPMMDVEP